MFYYCCCCNFFPICCCCNFYFYTFFLNIFIYFLLSFYITFCCCIFCILHLVVVVCIYFFFFYLSSNSTSSRFFNCTDLWQISTLSHIHGFWSSTASRDNSRRPIILCFQRLRLSSARTLPNWTRFACKWLNYVLNQNLCTHQQQHILHRCVCIIVCRRVVLVYVGSAEGNKLMGQSVQIIETTKNGHNDRQYV